MPEVMNTGEFSIDPSSGLLAPARFVESPNRDLRPEGADVELVVIHGISLPPGDFGSNAIEAFFTNTLDFGAHPYFEEIRGLEVSAHLLVRRTGEVIQFVRLNERAWHAGQSCYRGQERCNDFSIGIELEGEDNTPYDDRQYAVLTEVLQSIVAAYPKVDGECIVAHSDIAPGRKTDPGPAFDWQRLYDGMQNLSMPNDVESTP